jgi:2'-5' RNA ligase
VIAEIAGPRGLCIATVLTGDTGDRISELRYDIDRLLGIVQEHTVPHLTLVVLQRRRPAKAMERVVADVAAGTSAMSASGAGYGIFVGRHQELSVVHLAVTKTPCLADLHRRLVEQVSAQGATVDGQFDLEHWRPHVTLAEVGPGDVGRVMELLVGWRPRHWTVPVDNLAVLRPRGGHHVLHHLVAADLRTQSDQPGAGPRMRADVP